MAEQLQPGEQLWLAGHEVTFIDYHRSDARRIRAAIVRRHDEEQTRVVALWKLARDRLESVARANAIPVQLTGRDQLGVG